MGLFRRARVRDACDNEITVVDVLTRATSLGEQLQQEIRRVRGVLRADRAEYRSITDSGGINAKGNDD